MADSGVVEVDFVVVNAYSHYTTIVAQPWLHDLGTVSSTLHLKVRCPPRDHIEELVGSKFMARQWLEAAVMYQPEIES